MPIITLTTDWGDGDYYIGSLKACITALCGNVNFIDITHNIKHFNTLQAAFVLKNSYQFFPENTIHIIGVNSEPSKKNPIAVMRADNQFFIGANDGMLDIICNENSNAIAALPHNVPRTGFRALNIISRSVHALIQNADIYDIGEKCQIQTAIIGKPTYNENMITGSVIYVDSFGNAITNIDKSLFERIGRNRNFEILAQSNFVKITKLSEYYDDVENGSNLALFNSINMLELAINKGNIAEMQRLETRSAIIIKFVKNDNSIFNK